MKLICAMALLFSVSSFAQRISDYNIVINARGNQLTETSVQKLQGRVRIGFVIDANGLVEIVGLVASGQSFNNDWNTISSNNNSEDHLNLAFRNIYLRKVIGKTTIEAGALNNEPMVGNAGLNPSGWVDGVRVKVNTKIGDFKVVAGSLGDFKQPDVFQRKFQGNFIELEMDHKIFENLLSQTALEHFNGELYIREGLNLDLKILGDKVLKLFGEVLYDVERKALNYEIGAEFDLLKTITDKFENRLDMKIYYSNLDSRIPDRNSMAPAFYTYGPRVTMQIGGKVDKNGNMNWFTRASFGQDRKSRYDAGIQIKLGRKKN